MSYLTDKFLKSEKKSDSKKLTHGRLENRRLFRLKKIEKITKKALINLFDNLKGWKLLI